MDLCCKVMSLLFNMLFRFVITSFPRSKHILISWLQSLSTVILEPKIKMGRGDIYMWRCYSLTIYDILLWTNICPSGRSNTLLTKFVHSLSICLGYIKNVYALLRISYLGNIYFCIFKKKKKEKSALPFFFANKYDTIQTFCSFVRLMASGMAFINKGDHHVCWQHSLLPMWSGSHFLDPLILSFPVL